MKRLVDIACSSESCTHREYDVWLEAGTYPACTTCGALMERLWTSTASAVGDDIPGGLTIEHGVCHADGTPRTFYTKSSIAKAAKEKGLHWGAFLHGSPPGRRWV